MPEDEQNLISCGEQHASHLALCMSLSDKRAGYDCCIIIFTGKIKLFEERLPLYPKFDIGYRVIKPEQRTLAIVSFYSY